MPVPNVSLRWLVPATLALTTPAATVLVVLAGLGHLPVPAALLSAVATAGLTGLLLRSYSVDFVAIMRYLRDLAEGAAAKPPERLRSQLGEDVTAAIAQLQRVQAARAAQVRAHLGSSEAVLDTLPDPLFLLGPQRRLVRANIAARKLFGSDLAGRDLAALLRDPALLDAADGVLAGGPGRDVDFRLPVPAERDYRARLEPLQEPLADGSVALLALHDLTTIKRMEQMRADFVANASHELRTPLATLLGFIETLQGPARDDPEARERFLAIMHEQAGRMARLVNDLLSLSRIELNEHSQPLERIDLVALVRRVAQGLELHAKARGMEIVLSGGDGLPPVLGQEDELAQVFQNLIENAIKYGRDNTPIEVGFAARSDRLKQGGVCVSVRDHGDGIEKEHIPRLTERFFRVDTARSRKMGGTGLGLAIVKHVVNHHRGLLVIDSTPGQGSVFAVHLPTADLL